MITALFCGRYFADMGRRARKGDQLRKFAEGSYTPNIW